MNKFTFWLCFCSLLLSGCQSNKDERYNSLTPNQIYREGVKNVDKKRYTQAVEDFEALESRYPFGEYADKAQLGILYAYYLNDDFAPALPAVERFIRMYPRHPHVDYAYYMKGLIYFSEALGVLDKYFPMQREERDLTSAKKALTAFNTLIITFPHSLYTNDATLRMIYLRNQIAESELIAAKFYLRKGAYVATANRANFIITHLDQSPTIPEALDIMSQAYQKLDLNDLAYDTDRVIDLNFPSTSTGE